MTTTDARRARAPVPSAGRMAVVALGWPALVVVALTALALATYAPILRDHFALDDFIWLRATAGDPLDVWRRAVTFPADTPTAVETPFWRPLIDLYFWAMQRVFDARPLPYHLANLAAHVAVAALLVHLLRGWGQPRPLALIGGALFVVSPAYTFTVAWLSAATELFAALFGLLALALFRGAGHRTRVPALFAYALALTAKESAVIVLPVATLLTLCSLRGGPRRALAATARAVWPLAALTAGYLVFIYLGEYRAKAGLGLYRLDTHAAGHLWQHLTWLTLPVAPERAPWLDVLRPGAAVALLLVGPLAARRRRWLPVTLWAWTLLALLPYVFFVSGVEQRYTYPALVPYTMLLTVAVGALARAARHRLPARLIVGALGLATAGALLLSVSETRRQQAWLSGQAALYAALMRDAVVACGPLPAGSRITLVPGPLWDLYGASTAMALNLRYERASVSLGAPSPAQPLPDCALLYQDGRFVRSPLP